MIILVAQFWVAIDPIIEPVGSKSRVLAFFSVYLAAPVILCFYIFFKFWYKTKWVAIDKIDLDTGRYRTRVYPEEKQMPVWRTMLDALC